MSKKDEINVSKIISKELGLILENTQYNLDSWGKVDKWAKINSHKLIFIEIETSQKHPNTNVLKLWPFLEINHDLKILLIQTFFPDSPGLDSSRGKLGYWTAKKLEEIFQNRFLYEKIIISRNLEINNINGLKNRFIEFKTL